MGMDKMVQGESCEKRDSSLKASAASGCKATGSTKRGLIKRENSGCVFVGLFKVLYLFGCAGS